MNEYTNRRGSEKKVKKIPFTPIVPAYERLSTAVWYGMVLTWRVERDILTETPDVAILMMQ